MDRGYPNKNHIIVIFFNKDYLFLTKAYHMKQKTEELNLNIYPFNTSVTNIVRMKPRFSADKR